MFLRYPSDHDYEEKFWPFVFRLETVLAGIVQEGAPRIADLDDEAGYMFLFNALGNCLNTQNGLLPPNWWPTPAPSIEWFDDYLKREWEPIRKEARRIVSERQKESNDSGPSSPDIPSPDSVTNPHKVDSGNDPEGRAPLPEIPFDRWKIREYAHRSAPFRNFILPFADPDSGDPHPHDHHSDHSGSPDGHVPHSDNH